MNGSRRQSQFGIALLDVLLAMLVLGVGVMSIAPLLSLVAHSNSGAWQRAMAAQLAQHKLEDLRGFTQLDAGEAGVFGYDEIRNNAGGAERANGAPALAAGDVARSGSDYALNWTVTDINWCEPAALITQAPCAGSWRAQAKTVRVSVTWTDEWGEPQTLNLQSAIAALEPSIAAIALLRRPQTPPPRQTMPSIP